ncbi:unnamed protein product [Acanthoscelides obtectus]|uniref:DDE-1 domain-containing protein n=1 Tax=Acanthoscelides obtectus TaxID=200917 RepID=A0A9P0P172_ACAOB|nr:unnamed protein product [Acanthoscelides obtectus]CAK1667423.1 hypothetical protein AOBTE_LOCUS25829 [Acanthoscelides obtectus]
MVNGRLEKCNNRISQTYAYDLVADCLNLPSLLNNKKKIASKKWYYSFMSRHPELRLRQPENISIARSKGFNKTNVHEFFDVLEKIVDETGIDAFYIYNVDESARENGIILLQLPGHTTYRLQPLDVGVFKSVESSYMQVMANWFRTNVDQKVTQFEVATLLTEAYTNSATTHNAAIGFRASGVWPVNRNVFSDRDFVASENLLVPDTIEAEKEDTPSEVTDVTNENQANLVQEDPISSTSKLTQGERMRPHKDSNTVLIEKISPLPKPKIVKKSGERTKRVAQKVAILTESPYKNELEEKYALKARKYEMKKAEETPKTCFSNQKVCNDDRNITAG